MTILLYIICIYTLYSLRILEQRNIHLCNGREDHVQLFTKVYCVGECVYVCPCKPEFRRDGFVWRGGIVASNTIEWLFMSTIYKMEMEDKIVCKAI